MSAESNRPKTFEIIRDVFAISGAIACILGIYVAIEIANRPDLRWANIFSVLPFSWIAYEIYARIKRNKPKVSDTPESTLLPLRNREDSGTNSQEESSTGFVITDPPHGKVFEEGQITVKGSYVARPNPPDEMFLIVKRGNTYWPQLSFHVNINGTWSATLDEKARDGKPINVEILIVRLNEQGILWIKHYQQTIEKKKDWVGLDLSSLPRDVQADDSVTIQIRSKATT